MIVFTIVGISKDLVKPYLSIVDYQVASRHLGDKEKSAPLELPLTKSKMWDKP